MLNLAAIDFSNPKQALEDALENWQSCFGYKWSIGAELEFYLLEDKFTPTTTPLQKLSYNNKLSQPLPLGAAALNKHLTAQPDGYLGLIAERGEQQYEVTIAHNNKIETIAENLIKLRELIASYAASNNMQALFDSKPFAHDYGSAMHFHLSLHNKNNDNLFACPNPDASETELCYQVIAGLLESCSEYLPCFVPDISDLARLAPGYDAPTNLSWGGNNRTTMLRLPVTGAARRIEHRLASANANPYLALAAIINGAHYGIANKLTPPPRIYGNAYDKRYNLKAFRPLEAQP